MRLSEYLESKMHQPFEWGKNDCLRFVTDWAIDCTPYFNYDSEYSARKAHVRFLRDQNVSCVEEFFDLHFERVNHVPPRGSIVAKIAEDQNFVNKVYGLVDGDRGWFVNYEGLSTLPLEPDKDEYWIV